MDKELEQLLEQLKELTNETQSQFQSQTSSQDYASSETQNNSEEDVEEKFKAWKEIGIVRFASKYQNLPKFYQILNMVVPKADQKVLSDIKAGKVKDDYLDYLEEAYRETIKEIASFSKELLASQYQSNTSTNKKSQQQQPTYTMKDFYNDYKKYLEKITAKDVAVIKFLDGIEDNGRVRQTGIPRATIYENITLEEN
jgi:hypothetical protein